MPVKKLFTHHMLEILPIAEAELYTIEIDDLPDYTDDGNAIVNLHICTEKAYHTPLNEDMKHVYNCSVALYSEEKMEWEIKSRCVFKSCTSGLLYIYDDKYVLRCLRCHKLEY